MSTRFLISVGGAAAGFLIGGGPTGAMWGWTLGSIVGNAVDPPIIRGPKVGDLAQQTTEEGVPIPITYGLSPPMAGSVICAAPARIVTESRSAKGGPKVESEAIYRTYAILFCEGPKGGFVRVWRNNTKVFDVFDPDFNTQEERVFYLPGMGSRYLPSRNDEFLASTRFFLGTYDQEPSPDLEADFGVGTTPAHRGMAYMVKVDENVTREGGAIPLWYVQISDDPVTILSNPLPSGDIGSMESATVSVTTNQASGTFYVVLGMGTELDGITAAQIIAGQNASGAAAVDADDSIVSDVAPAVEFSGLSPGTTYRFAAVQVSDFGTSNIVRGVFSTQAGVAPELSNPTPSGTIGTTTTAEVGADTTQDFGVFSVVLGVGTQLDGITADEIKAGNMAGGANALFADDTPVTDFSPSVPFTGLDEGTEYKYAAVQETSGGTSNIVTGVFTTAGTPFGIIAATNGGAFVRGYCNEPLYGIGDFGDTTTGTSIVINGREFDCLITISGGSPRLELFARNTAAALTQSFFTSFTLGGNTYATASADLFDVPANSDGRWTWNNPAEHMVDGNTYSFTYVP